MKQLNFRLVQAVKVFDPLWRLFALLPRRNKNEIIFNILVVDLHLIGDIVMLQPLLAAIRFKYPSAYIALVAGSWAKQILANENSVDEYIQFNAAWVIKKRNLIKSFSSTFGLIKNLRKREWDLCIDVRGDIRNILIMFFAKGAKRVGYDFMGGKALLTDVVYDDGTLKSIIYHHEQIAKELTVSEQFFPFIPRLNLSPIETESAALIESFWGFHFGASLPLRRFPVEEAIKVLNFAASSTDNKIVLFDSPDIAEFNKEVVGRINQIAKSRLLLWKGGLRDFIVYVSRAEVMFTMDSGPGHIASALGVKTYVIFGPNISKNTAPRGDNVRIIERAPALPCQPCDQHRCTNENSRQSCLRGLFDEYDFTKVGS